MSSQLFAPIEKRMSNVLLCVEKCGSAEKFTIFSNRQKAFNYLIHNNSSNEMVYCKKTGYSFTKPLLHYSMFYNCVRPGVYTFFRACAGKPFTSFTFYILKQQ